MEGELIPFRGQIKRGIGKKKTSVDEVEHRLARDEVGWLKENFLNISEERILNYILEWNRLRIAMYFDLNIERWCQIRKKNHSVLELNIKEWIYSRWTVEEAI